MLVLAGGIRQVEGRVHVSGHHKRDRSISSSAALCTYRREQGGERAHLKQGRLRRIRNTAANHNVDGHPEDCGAIKQVPVASHMPVLGDLWLGQEIFGA